MLKFSVINVITIMELFMSHLIASSTLSPFNVLPPSFWNELGEVQNEDLPPLSIWNEFITRYDVTPVALEEPQSGQNLDPLEDTSLRPQSFTSSESYREEEMGDASMRIDLPPKKRQKALTDSEAMNRTCEKCRIISSRKLMRAPFKSSDFGKMVCRRCYDHIYSKMDDINKNHWSHKIESSLDPIQKETRGDSPLPEFGDRYLEECLVDSISAYDRESVFGTSPSPQIDQRVKRKKAEAKTDFDSLIYTCKKCTDLPFDQLLRGPKQSRYADKKFCRHNYNKICYKAKIKVDVHFPEFEDEFGKRYL